MWADLPDLLVIGIKLAAVLGVLLTTVPIMVWVERRGSALIQDRLGPNRVGPFGLLQPVVDAVKLITKENLIPGHVNKLLYILAPTIALIVALSTFIAVPFGQDSDLHIFGYAVDGFIVAPDLNIGILYIFAIASLAVYSTVLAGWSSNNKYSLLGGIRASAQTISYELAMTISVVGVLMSTGSLKLADVVNEQAGWFWNWNGGWQLLGAVTFMVAAFAETNRLPFDLPEAEAELVAGYHTEYSSMKFAAFFMSEYVHMVTSSALIVVFFLGGWHLGIPLDRLGISLGPWATAILSIGVFAAKVAFFLWFFVWVRWTLPRFRFDQLMKIGWKIMIPIATLNFLIIGAIMAWQATKG